jgi:hypothetical protein
LESPRIQPNTYKPTSLRFGFREEHHLSAKPSPLRRTECEELYKQKAISGFTPETTNDLATPITHGNGQPLPLRGSTGAFVMGRKRFQNLRTQLRRWLGFEDDLPLVTLIQIQTPLPTWGGHPKDRDSPLSNRHDATRSILRLSGDVTKEFMAATPAKTRSSKMGRPQPAVGPRPTGTHTGDHLGPSATDSVINVSGMSFARVRTGRSSRLGMIGTGSASRQRLAQSHRSSGLPRPEE